MKTKRLTFQNGFHGAATATVRARWRGESLYLSSGQVSAADRKVCGIKECRCEGISRCDLRDDEGESYFLEEQTHGSWMVCHSSSAR